MFLYLTLRSKVGLLRFFDKHLKQGCWIHYGPTFRWLFSQSWHLDSGKVFPNKIEGGPQQTGKKERCPRVRSASPSSTSTFTCLRWSQKHLFYKPRTRTYKQRYVQIHVLMILQELTGQPPPESATFQALPASGEREQWCHGSFVSCSFLVTFYFLPCWNHSGLGTQEPTL